MAFEFQLSSLLEYRQHLLEDAQVSLANAQNRYQALCAEQEQLKTHIEQQQKELNDRQSRGIQVAEYVSCISYLKSLEQNLLSLKERAAKALGEVDAARNALQQRETEAQALEVLKTRAREEYRYQELKREQKRLDATAIFADYHKREKVRYE